MNTISAPAWSFVGRIESKKTLPTPGPSDYEPKSTTLKNPPVVKIGKSEKSYKSRNVTPGPGAYLVKNSDSVNQGVTIGKSTRKSPFGENKTPGPGSYDIRPKETEGPKFSMPGRAVKLLIKSNPGPGHYDSDLNDFTSKVRAPTFKIGTEIRSERPSSANPGPGAYNPDGQELGPKWKFGSQSRENFLQTSNPGPGSYSIPTSFKVQGCSMTSRRSVTPQEPTPGPGAYNPPLARPKSPNWKIGTSARSEFKQSKDSTPGPGSYSPLLQSHKSAAIFNRASRESFIPANKNPGPGDYNKETSSSSGPAYTMRPKTSEKTLETVPGPGNYEVTGSIDRTGWTIGKDSRTTFVGNKKNKVPGPGQYEPEPDQRGPKWVFGTAPKESKRFKKVAPGPGSYNISSSFANLPSYVKIFKSTKNTN